MGEHYFTEDPGSKTQPRKVNFTAYGKNLELESSTGVFSGDRLDIGTAVLFRETPLPAREGVFLDLGCGYGPIACVLATQVPGSIVWAVDVNARALALCRTNKTNLGVDEALKVALPDDVPVDTRFDQIWSNPPIRAGKDTLHELMEQWLPRLSEDGIAWLVVGRNLGADSLQRWLQGKGWRAERHASAKGFRVLRVTNGLV